MELEVEIPNYLKHLEDESKGRAASKVSKIATMFQCPSENEEKDEKEGPGPATVVRTESHVARFNTARALFEKMAEKKEDSKTNKCFNHKRQFCPLQTSRSIPSSCGKTHSRSPSPPITHSSHQSNGHHCSSCKSNLSSVSTIASISYTSTNPSFHSSVQNPSAPPPALPFKARSSSFDSEALKGNKWHNTIPGAETSKLNYSEPLRCKSECTTKNHQNDECCSTNRVYHSGTLPAKIDDGSRDFINRKYEQPLGKAIESKSKGSLLSKPDKPTKPETLIDKPLSSHLQNQQIIQRHKNWFQAFSKTKSPLTSPPLTSPQKLHQQAGDSQPPCNASAQRRHSEDPAAIHNDWRRERSVILKSSGRNGHQDVEENDGKGSVDVANIKNFENASTLPSCWSPPQQYNESSSNKSDISSSFYQDTHPIPSSSANEETKRCSSRGDRAIEGKTYIITDISKDTRISHMEKKNVIASQIDMKNVGVFRKETEQKTNSSILSSSLPREGERRNKDHAQDSSHSEEEAAVKSNIVFRQRTADLSRDKEKRLKEWEKRLSQRESGFYNVSDVTGERHSNRDSFGSKFEEKYLSESSYDRKDSVKSSKDSREYYHEDYLHKTYKMIEKDAKQTERFEREDDDKERKKLLQTEREKIVREERRSHEFDKNVVYSEDQTRLRGREVKEEGKGIYDRKNDNKHSQFPRKEKDDNLDSFIGKRSINEPAAKIEKFEERLKIDDKREKPKRDEKEREKLRKEFEERERLLKDEKQQEKLLRESEEHERLRSKEDDDSERFRRHKVERERMKREEEHDKKRKHKEDLERVRRESGERERSILEEDRAKGRKEDKDWERMKREKEEWMRMRREMEEKERAKGEDRELDKLRRGGDGDLDRQWKEMKEMKELEILKRHEEERAKLKRKELEKLRREEEERERMKKEEEEKRRLRREVEMEKFRKEEEENERLRRDIEEKEKLKKEEESRERIKKEKEERLKKNEEEKLRKEFEEKLRREEEERIMRENEERLRKEEEERFRKEEEERFRKEEEEKLRRQEEERLRREEEEILRMEEKERLRREEEENVRRKEEERLRRQEEERLRREEEERLRRAEKERLRREEEERMMKEEEDRIRREEEERMRREEEERLRRQEEERIKKEEERLRREEVERLRREEEERLRREEEEERLRREEEEERLRREEEEEKLRIKEEERLRREEEERLRRKEEERLRREEEERLRRKEQERLRREEEEKLRREEEEERLRRKEEDRLRREEEERLRRKEEEKLRREEEEKSRREEEERLRREEEEKSRREEEKLRREEEEERLRRKEEESLIRKLEEDRVMRREEEILRRKEEEEIIRKEEERLQNETMEKESLSKEKHGWKEENKEVISLRKEEQIEDDRGKNVPNNDPLLIDNSNIEEDNKTIISHKDELEKRWQAKREKLEEEERLRREKDRIEIEKTKKRIAELKKERDEIQRQQAIRLRMLMKGGNNNNNSDDVDENSGDYNEILSDNSKDDESESSSPNEEENQSPIKNIITTTTTTQESENFKIETIDSSHSDATIMKEDEAFQVSFTFYENKSTPSAKLEEDSLEEEVTYDHTVQSAQHKIEFCSGSYNESISKDVHNTSSASNFDPFSVSTISSDFEPLPPPVPPHNIDPAILTANHIIEQTPLPPLPPQTLDVSSVIPEPMTPEEAEKLLSHNIIETKKSLISEALEADSSRELNTSDVCPTISEVNEDSLIKSKDEGNDDDEDDGFDKDYDSVCVESPTADNEEDPDDSFSSFKHEVTEEGFVVRAKEVLSEDGIHYLEDGHFWIQVPGLMEDDEDDIPDTVPFHKHTKLKFSLDPIKLYSTFSVTDYDRRNDEVDPVAASAEYELEKRVEKMNVFPVSIDKGDGGLGLSIIGMGVGADAGVEKLGIFVKTITLGGATDRDGRIKVNDQIIEVDNQSLVGVTQMFAASVLKNTSGTVNFLIGRENDPENSEVAMLIRQSLMADHERDERRRALEGPNYDPRDAGGVFESFSSQSGGESPSEDGPRGSNFVRDLHREPNIYGQEYGDQFGDVYTSCQSLSPRGTSSPPPEAFNHDVEGRELLLQNNEIMIMSQHLQEIQHRNEMYEEEINILRNKICELEKELGNVSEMTQQLQETNARIKEAEDTLKSKQTEIATYQDMLEQSQGQYIILEKKYYKAKKIIKEYQSRERDFLHREEYHITQLEEKDVLYNSLVKALKDRVIQLEGDLIKAQKEAGLPVKVPPDLNVQSSNFVQSTKGPDNHHSSLQRDPPRKPSTLINCLDPDLSDTEAGDTHTSEGSKSSTVERKIPSKEELDVAVPPTELLDNSFSKAKGELASRGGLANRQLPSLKKSASNASSNSFDNSLEDGIDDTSSESQLNTQIASQSIISTKSTVSSISQNESAVNISHSHTSMSSFTSNSHSSTQENIAFTNSRSHPPPPYHSTTSQTSVHPPSPHHQPPPYQPPPSAPLSHRPVVASDSHSSRNEGSYRHPPPVARVQPVNRVEALPSPTSPNSQQQQQQTLANQLKALLAEREGRTEVAHESNRDGSPIKKSPSSLMEDVRRAVMQADISIGKKPVISGPIHVSSTAQVVSTGQFVHSRTSPQKGVGTTIPQKVSRDSGTWSPVINSSTAGGVVLLSQRPIDSSLPLSQANEVGAGMDKKSGMASSDSNSSFDTHQQQERVFSSGRSSKESSIMSVFDWNKEQVAQWLVLQGLENYVSTFVNAGITGPRLVNIDTKDLKNLGLSSDDKNKIKRKVKELRQNLEKERKQIEKENKEREKLQKKAEKLAEKAERRKK